MNLLFGYDQEIADWTAARMPVEANFGICRSIGVVSDGQLIAGVVYHFYQPEYGTIAVSIAAETPRWAARGVIRALLSYPFEQLNVNKLWSSMLHTNSRAIRFNKGIGFTQEAVLRDHYGPGRHAVLTRMMQRDYMKQYGGEHGRGQKSPVTARAA